MQQFSSSGFMSQNIRTEWPASHEGRLLLTHFPWEKL
jgi:hypothetical protein